MTLLIIIIVGALGLWFGFEIGRGWAEAEREEEAAQIEDSPVSGRTRLTAIRLQR